MLVQVEVLQPQAMVGDALGGVGEAGSGEGLCVTNVGDADGDADGDGADGAAVPSSRW